METTAKGETEMKLTPQQLAEIRELALVATGGPWTAHDGGLSKRKAYNPITKKDEPVNCSCAQVHCEYTTVAVAIGANDESYTLGEGVTDKQRCVNAAYIAAANPTAMLEIIDHITALEAAVQERQGMELTAHQYHENWKTAEATITALEVENAELVKHTTHLDGCHITYTNDGPKMCSCHLYELLSKQEHVCGLQGFNGMLGDECPACIKEQKP